MQTPLRISTAADAARYRLAWTVHPADRTTPVRAFERLRAAGHHAALLESALGPARLARHSFVALDPDARLTAGPRGATLTDGGKSESLDLAPHLALREAHRRRRMPAAPPGLPPFRGGWLGFFAYEWASTLEPRVARVAADPFEVPDALFDHYPDAVAFDHAAQTVTILCAAPDGESGYRAALKRAERIAADMEGEPPEEHGFRLLDEEPQACTVEGDYLAGVERLRHEIRQGEIFQAVLSQRFERRFDGDPFTLYRVLRLVNPAPHMFFFEADGVTLVGSSPERLVSVQDGRVQVVPIAGTRPRGRDEAEDDRLGAELRRDEKERAEHDMLVDLARNDAGRVARVGSVLVREYAVLEKFPRVQHLVSRVECDLSPGRDALDALAAAFPAGTVSGAPKVRAMELLAELEPTARGPYAGAFGYLDGAGELDVAIIIRTIVCRGDTLHVQAGAGVVFDSDPEKERQETLHKARALFDAVDLAATPAFQPTQRASSPEGASR